MQVRSLSGAPTEEVTMSGPNWHLVYVRQQKRWVTKEEGTGRILLSAKYKKKLITETAELGRLQNASVRIHKRNGQIQEERTYRRDPHTSRG